MPIDVRAACRLAAERAMKRAKDSPHDAYVVTEEFSKLIRPLVEALMYYDGDESHFMSSIPARTALAEFEKAGKVEP
jgi:hypothetical protein